MKKLLCLIMISCFILSGCDNSASTSNEQPKDATEQVQDNVVEEIKPEPIKIENPDFRNTKWGMTMEEVKASESGLFIDGDEEIIAYSAEVAGYPATAVYQFENNSLASASYTFDCEHTNENLWIEDFYDLKDRFIAVYGETLNSNDENWKDDLFKGDSNDYGLAVAIGDLSYTSIWETETTKLGISLTGDNYEIFLGAFYCPTGYEFEKSTDGI